MNAIPYKRHMAAQGLSLKSTFIRAWRKHRGLTQVELGERLGVTHGLLSKIENGHAPYNQALLEGLAREMGCTEVDLLTRDPTSPIADQLPPEAARDLIAAATRIVAAAGVTPGSPVTEPIARLMVLHVARRLSVHLAPDDPQLADLAQDLKAFAARAADPRLQKDLAAAEQLLTKLGDRTHPLRKA